MFYHILTIISNRAVTTPIYATVYNSWKNIYMLYIYIYIYLYVHIYIYIFIIIIKDIVGLFIKGNRVTNKT